MAHAVVGRAGQAAGIARAAAGLAGLAAVAWVSRWIGSGLPAWLGAPVVGLLLGVALRRVAGQQRWLHAGADFTLKRLLRLAVILFGSTLSLGRVAAIGGQALGLIAVTVALALGLTWVFGRRVMVPPRLSALIGAGTAICGATAIVTVAPILRAEQDETAFALSTIFLFNMLAVLVYPLAGQLLHLSDVVFGVWAGTAIHDTSSVLAAAYAYSEAAGQVATVVKLTRTLMLIPLALLLAVAAARRTPGSVTGPEGFEGGFRLSRAFPWFVLGFLGMAGLNSLGLLSPAWVAAMNRVAQFLIVMVLVSVGYGADFQRVRRLGSRPLLVGLFASVVIAVASLMLARLAGL